jgi:predicted transcriptional regulator
MPRIPTKTSVLTVRVAPEVKAALQEVADTERRSLANMLEVAVLAYCGKSHSTRKPERKVRREQ